MPDKAEILGLIKLVAWGAAIIAGVFGGTGGLEENTHQQLHATEARAAVDNAEVEIYGAYDSFREYIMDVEVKKAACDSALEGLARHRTDDDDFKHVLEECHSEGVIE